MAGVSWGRELAMVPLARERLEQLWDANAMAPGLTAEYCAARPGLADAVSVLDDGVPVQRVWSFARSGPFVRPDRHVRAYYLDLASAGLPSGGVLAFKGTEVAAENLELLVRRLESHWNVYSSSLGGYSRNRYIPDFALLNSLERFPVAEGKAPIAVVVSEALEEAQAALALQTAHRARYGTFAHAPYPIGVFRWPDTLIERYRTILARHLSEKAMRIVSAQVAEGFGVYVYHYPVVPHRVSHMDVPDVGPTVSYDQRLERLTHHADPARVVDGWLDFTAKLLCLGFIATDPASACRGYCVEPQNLVLDGGIVDMGSLRRLESMGNSVQARFAIDKTVRTLARSILYFLVGSEGATELFGDRTPDPFRHVWNDVARRIRKESSNGLALPAAVERALTDRGAYEDLSDMLRALYGLRLGLEPDVTSAGEEESC